MVSYSGERKFVIARLVRRGNLLRPVLLLAVGILLFPQISNGAGPWKGQVVDAETKQPVDEVIVIAVWTTLEAGEAVFLRHLDSEEVVTGNDGKFNIPAKRFTQPPRLYLFKPGHGSWRFQGEDEWSKLDPSERRKRYIEADRQLADNGVTIELVPLKSRLERLQFYQTPRPGPFGLVPPEKMKRWQQADENERTYLGLLLR
jgi:hypothetical protein